MYSRMETIIQKISIERSLNDVVIRAAFRDFLQALHETQVKSWHQKDGGSLVKQIYLSLGDEAAYHLGGILAENGNEDVTTELEIMDSRLKRFSKIVELWKIERDYEIEDRK